MLCLYINLDGAQERRRLLEESFAQHAPRNWRLERVEAMPASTVAMLGLRGRIRDPEKACFMSHLLALETAAREPGPALVLEDDALFGPSSTRLLEKAMAAAQAEQVQVVFADLIVADTVSQLRLFERRRQTAGAPELLDPSSWSFAGASAYGLPAGAAAGVLQAVGLPSPMDLPYDLHLRALVRSGRLKSRVAFPFPLTVSDEAFRTQIQHGAPRDTDAVWNAVRRLLWADRSLDDVERLVQGFGASRPDRELGLALQLLAMQLVSDFRGK